MLEAEERALASKNGMAAVKVLEIRMRRDRALEREIIERDGRVMWLMDEEDRLRAENQAAHERIAALRQECRELEKRESALHQAIDASEHELVVRLRELDGAGHLDGVLEATGLLERVDDDGEAA
jgi:hypothetical protein